MKFLFITLLAINPFGTPSVSAKTDWQVVQTLKLVDAPVTIAVFSDFQ